MLKDTRNVLKAAWRAHAVAFPTRFAPAHAELEFSCCGIPVPLFNQAYPKKRGPLEGVELNRMMREFRAVLAAHRVSGYLMARADLISEDAGVAPFFKMPGMVAGELLPPARRLPRAEIREVRGMVMTREIARLNVEAHEMKLEDAEEMSKEGLWQAPNHGFLLYQDGMAVAAGAVTFAEGVSYVGWMATQADYRGRGFAEVVLRHMDAFMRRKYSVKESALHATPLGRPVYERLGYRVVDEFAAYLCVAEGAAAAHKGVD